MNNLKLTVVVLCYNHGFWLAECLDSILQQKTDFDFETIIGDDASSDSDTNYVIDKYSKMYKGRLSFIRRSKNIGGSNNYFDMMQRARGQYIAYIDGDDIMLPGKLQQQAEYLDKNHHIAMVGHHMLELSGGKRIKSPAHISRSISVNELLLMGCPFAASSKMFRKSAIRTAARSRLTVDYFLHIDHALSGDIGIISDYLGVYRKNVGISSNPSFKKLIAIAYMDALDHAADNGAPRLLMLKARCLMRMRMSVNFLQGGDWNSFRKWCNSIPVDERPYISVKHRLLRFLSINRMLSTLAMLSYLQCARIFRRLRPFL